MSRALVLAAAVLLADCASAPPVEKKPPRETTPMVGTGSTLHAWTEIVGGTPMAKALVKGPCPEILLDDRPAARMRGGTVCEHPLTLPDGRLAARAQIADRLLPLPGTAPARLAVIQEIDATVAKTLARRRMPTLVVFLGDWNQDLLEPAGELLQVAPWLMARENPPSEGPAFHAIRLFQELGKGHSYLWLVSTGGESWDATLSSPSGDETRTCRLDEGGFDCDLR